MGMRAVLSFQKGYCCIHLQGHQSIKVPQGTQGNWWALMKGLWQLWAGEREPAVGGTCRSREPGAWGNLVRAVALRRSQALVGRRSLHSGCLHPDSMRAAPPTPTPTSQTEGSRDKPAKGNWDALTTRRQENSTDVHHVTLTRMISEYSVSSQSL